MTPTLCTATCTRIRTIGFIEASAGVGVRDEGGRGPARNSAQQHVTTAMRSVRTVFAAARRCPAAAVLKSRSVTLLAPSRRRDGRAAAAAAAATAAAAGVWATSAHVACDAPMPDAAVGDVAAAATAAAVAAPRRDDDGGGGGGGVESGAPDAALAALDAAAAAPLARAGSPIAAYHAALAVTAGRNDAEAVWREGRAAYWMARALHSGACVWGGGGLAGP